MSAQTVVGAGAVGLLAVNEWTNSDHAVLGGVLWNGKDPAAAHKALVRIAGELMFVIVVTLLAGLGGSWPKFAGAVVAALWVLWAINHYNGGKQP